MSDFWADICGLLFCLTLNVTATLAIAKAFEKGKDRNRLIFFSFAISWPVLIAAWILRPG